MTLFIVPSGVKPLSGRSLRYSAWLSTTVIATSFGPSSAISLSLETVQSPRVEQRLYTAAALHRVLANSERGRAADLRAIDPLAEVDQRCVRSIAARTDNFRGP